MSWYRRERKVYYELPMYPKEKQAFLTIVRKRLDSKHLSIQDLAKAIGRPRQSVYNYFSNDKRTDKFLAAEIATYLNIDRQDWWDIMVEQARERVMSKRLSNDAEQLRVDEMIRQKRSELNALLGKK